MALKLQFLTHSEIGLVRKNNQDSGYASPHLLLVADGMGGAAAGDLASAAAVEMIRQVDAPTPGDQMLPALAGAIAAANHKIAELVDDDLALDGMGTTVTGALFDGEELGLVHIGDSRAYLFRDDRLERLTHDHSWVQSLVDDGKIDENEAAVHPHRSLLLRVLNGQPTNEPDLTRIKLQEGDRLLICSDGLCGLVEDAEIAEALRLPDLPSTLDRLVAAAHTGGGIDNITVILADVVPGAPAVAGDTVEAVVLGAAAERTVPDTGGHAAVRLERDDNDDDDSEDGEDGEDVDHTTAPLPPGRSGDTLLHDDEARYNPQPPRKRRVLRPLAGILVGLLVVAVAAGAAYAWGRAQYYVGARDTQVAIYQGLPGRVLVPLSRVFEVQPLAVADLPPFYADQVRTGIEVASLGSARQTVAELTEVSQRCARSGGSPKPGPSSSPTKGAPTPIRPEVPTNPSASASATLRPGC